MTLKLGVIGAGRIGKVHAENLVYRIPEAQDIAVADVIIEPAQALAQQLGIPTVTANYQEILDDTEVDAVVICSSTDTHTEIIEKAAAAGKHIFTEKPIDLNLQKIDHTLQCVEDAGVKLQVGFNRRFDPNFSRIKQAIEDGEIGDPHILHIISRDPGPPPIEYVKVSGGIFVDMMIHDFDMARFLIGSEIEEVYTRAAVRVDPAIGEAGDVDTAIVVLKFANGVIGTIDNSRKAVYGYDQRVEVFGSKGAVSAANRYPNQVTFSSGENIRQDLPLHFFIERYMESYIVEIRAFVDAVVHGAPLPTTGIDGRIPVAVGVAARKSYDENRPVKVE